MTDWNASDPDASRVIYDLSEWDFDQQAEIASALADAEVPHGWAGNELIVPEEYEDATDELFAEVEQRLSVIGKPVPTNAQDAEDAFVDDADGDGFAARELDESQPVTDYDLTEWADLERTLVSDSLSAAGIPFAWDLAARGDGVLSVQTVDEDGVDDILDEVESGNVIPVIHDGPDGDVIPFESLNSFFLAGERLRKDPHDADGLERLVEAISIADPDRPPRGVELRVWRRSCTLAERLADMLIDEAEGVSDDDADGFGVDGDDGLSAGERAQAVAEELHDLLRPLI